MSAENNDVVARPDRSPDVTTPVGHAIWWPEMIFMHSRGGFFKINVDQTGAVLYITVNGKKQMLQQSGQDLYDTWWYESFEKTVLGGGSDE